MSDFCMSVSHTFNESLTSRNTCQICQDLAHLLEHYKHSMNNSYSIISHGKKSQERAHTAAQCHLKDPDSAHLYL